MEDSCERQEDVRRLRQLLDTLPARERQILLLRYGLAGQPPLTQLEAAGQEEISIHRAYELLLQAQAGSGSALKELEQYKAYLGEYALKLYENLVKEGE